VVYSREAHGELRKAYPNRAQESPA
jgi:hypothetical protein